MFWAVGLYKHYTAYSGAIWGIEKKNNDKQTIKTKTRTRTQQKKQKTPLLPNQEKTKNTQNAYLPEFSSRTPQLL